MPSNSVVLPATRIPRKLWTYLEQLMKRKMLATKTEVVKEALREYVLHHKDEIEEYEFNIQEAKIILEEGRREDEAGEMKLLECIDKLLARH